MRSATGNDHLANIARSERKREVVLGIARGKTIPEIAADMGLAERTVKQHMEQMRLAFGGVARREIPHRWYMLTGENPYPTDAELEVM